MSKLGILRRSRFSAIFILIILADFFTGCGPAFNEDIVFDAILELRNAERNYQQIVVDLSDPDDFKYLAKGWHFPEIGHIPKTKFLWSSEKHSIVNFPVTKKEDLELIISIRPFVFDGAPENTLSLRWNDKFLGTIKLAADWRVYRLDILSEFLQIGENTLSIHHTNIYTPSEVWENSTDNRQLGASYAYFVLRKKQEPIPSGNYTLPTILGEKDLHFTGIIHHIMYDHSPSKFVFKANLPSRPVLKFGIGIMPDTVRTDRGPAKFRISVSPVNSNSENVIFKASKKPPRRLLEGGWTQYRRDLSEYANKSVAITFETFHEDQQSAHYNEGSWHEPQILNRHVANNLIIIIGTGLNWPSKAPDTDSPTARLYSISTIFESFGGIPGYSSMDQDQPPIPADVINKFQHEGWQMGYFVANRNQFRLEDLYSDQFDALVGTEVKEAADLSELIQQAFNWIQRLESNYVLIFEFAGYSMEDSIQSGHIDSIFDTILSWGIEKKSIILLCNQDSDHPICFHQPNQQSDVFEQNMIEWNELKSKIYEILHLDNN